MNYHRVVHRTKEAAPDILSAERLAHLRHDLRTPFNQIIGYTEMLAEDADDRGQTEAAARAAELVTSAHEMLAMLTRALTREPHEVTPQYLAGMRDDLTGPMLVLNARRDALVAVAVDDPEGNLIRVEAALTNLRNLVAATSRWHSEEEEHTPEAPLLSPVAALHTENLNADTILIVDDHADNRDLLRQRLTREGFRTITAENGEDALTLLEQHQIDLVLLDVLMPGIDGTEVLLRIKGSERTSSIPVIMISALDEIERVVHCIESGAEDYLTKPFNPVLLRARIGATLDRKRLHDEERRQHEEMQMMNRELARERENAHNLLLNILPESVAMELQQGSSAPTAFEDCTICFTDFVGFTLSTENMPAQDLVAELNVYFTAFDRVMERYGLEKMKTIGDSYMFASGLPERHPANAVNAVLAALELAHITAELAQRAGSPGWKLRIGLHTGPVIAGVVGIRKFAYDIWGDSVNFASRMESSGAPDRINVSERTYARIKDFFTCEYRGKIATKDKRDVDMYFVTGVQPAFTNGHSAEAFAQRYREHFHAELPAFPDFLLR